MLRATLLPLLIVVPLVFGLVLLYRVADLPFAVGYALFAVIVGVGAIASAELEPPRRSSGGG